MEIIYDKLHYLAFSLVNNTIYKARIEKKKSIFKSVPKPQRLATFFRFRLDNFLRKNPQIFVG